MSLSAALETAIGLVFLYLLLSLIATWINEGIAATFQLRAKALEKAIENLIKDPKLLTRTYMQKRKEELKGKARTYETFVGKFYGNPIIKVLGKEKAVRKGEFTDRFVRRKRGPSYIASDIFASVAFSIMLDEAQKKIEIERHRKQGDGDLNEGEDSNTGVADYTTITGEELVELISKIPYADAREALLSFYKNGATTGEKLRAELGKWFDKEMERLSGWYKRRAQLFAFIIGVVLALALNADTLLVADALYRDPKLRSSVMEYVERNAALYEPPRIEGAADPELCGDEPSTTPSEEDQDVDIPVDEIRKTLEDLDYPIGWTTFAPRSILMRERAESADQPGWTGVARGWAGKALGWFITALAVSMGAPFWFDLLGKLVNLRSSGVIPTKEEKQDETLGNVSIDVNAEPSGPVTIEVKPAAQTREREE
jgi:hypothetical protein